MNYQEHKMTSDYKKSKAANKAVFIISTLVVCFGAFLMLFPYFYMIICALKTPQEVISGSIINNFWPSEPVWSNFIDVFIGNERYPLSSFNLLDAIKNTLL